MSTAINQDAADAGRGNSAAEMKGNTTATEKLAQAAHYRIDKAAEVGANVEQKTRAMARDTSERAEEVSTRTMARTREQIEQNPLVAVGAAFAVGFIISALLRR